MNSVAATFGQLKALKIQTEILAALPCSDFVCAGDRTANRIGALRIAARFFDRSNETMIFRRGMDANNHPGFYRQLGKVPQELVTAALALLQKRFDLT